jgi:MinD-like ATPase involved in chromosome partitioning or flagellar assembly
MALIAIASDKGAPGVTTAALALAAVWPRPVLLAECDPAGGDLVYRFPAVGGGHLDPRRGVLSLAVVARRGMQPQQVWEHVQKLHGGLDVLAGVTNAEQGAGLSLLWGPIGKALASMPQADVIADCGRLGADGPLYDLLAEATTVVLVSKVHVADVIRLRDRAAAFAAAAQSRGRRNFGVGVVVVADHKKFRASLGEVQHVLGQANAPATVLGGIAHDIKGADLLNGEWGGNLDRTMLIKTAREVARQLVQGLPPIGNPAEPGPAMPSHAQPQPVHLQPAHSQLAPRDARPATGPQPPATGPPPPATGPHPGWSSGSPQPAVAPSAPAAPTPVPAMTLRGPAQHSPAQHSPASQSPADLAAVTLPAPTVSDDAPRTTFSRIRGRPGRHQAEPGQAPNGQLPADQTSSSPARHRQEPGDRHGSVFSRPPMAPLSTSDAQAPAGLPEQEDAEDAGWGATPWDRQGPAGSMGSRRSGGG